MRGWLAALVGCAATGCGAQTYVCQSAEQCNDGTCQPSGYCSFADPECESGQRYGEFASVDLSGRCVQADAGTSSTTTMESTAPPIGPSTSSDAEDSTNSSGADASTAAIGDGTSSTSTTSAGESSGSTGLGADPDLIAWWRLDDDPAIEAQDATPNGLDGTCAVCPTSVPAIYGQGFAFTGAEVITVDDPDPFVADTFTIAAWIRVAGVDAPNSYHHIVTKPVGVGTRNSWEMLLANTTTVRVQFVVSNPTQSSVTTVLLPAFDTWMHVVGSYDGETVRLYLDGELQSELVGPSDGVAWDDNPAIIGGDIDSEVLHATFIGDIDDIRVYGRALDVTEVAALATPP